MLLQVSFSILFLFFLSVRPGNTQETASDAQAVAVLTQTLAASGIGNSRETVPQFTAEGTMVYFLGGGQIEVLSTIRAKGRQWRVDANLPRGVRTIALGRDAATRKDEEGKLTEIPLHNRISMGGTTFPYLAIKDALNDASVSVSYVGVVEADGRNLHQIRAKRSYTTEEDSLGILSRLSETDFYIDAQTNLVVKVVDLTHPIETLTEDYIRETVFEDYTSRSGVSVPTVARQKIGESTIWEFRLSNITFNSDLNDADFTIQ